MNTIQTPPPVWIIQEGVFDSDETNSLIQEIIRQGSTVEMVPSQLLRINRFRDPRGTAPVVFRGGLDLVQHIQRNWNDYPWCPGPICNLDQFRCSSYYPRIGSNLLNSDYVMLPAGDLARRFDDLCEWFGSERHDRTNATEFFVRPNRGTKDFIAGVVTRDDVPLVGVPDDTLVVAAKRIPLSSQHSEYRFVVAGHTVLTGSRYKTNGELDISPNVNPAALDLAKKVASDLWDADVSPDPVYILDVMVTRAMVDGYGTVEQAYVVELNAFASSGLYACDPAPIVAEVNRISVNEWREYWEE